MRQMPGAGQMSPALQGDQSSAGYGPNGMMHGSGMGMPPVRLIHQ